MKSTGRRETTYARACASLFYLSVPLCIRPLSCGWYAPPKFSSCTQGNSSHFSLFLIYRVYRRSRRLLRVISFGREAQDTIFPRNETMQRRRLILWRFRLKNELFFYYKFPFLLLSFIKGPRGYRSVQQSRPVPGTERVEHT